MQKYYVEPTIFPETQESCVFCPFARGLVDGKLYNIWDTPLGEIDNARYQCAIALCYDLGNILQAREMVRKHPHMFDCEKYYEFLSVGLNVPRIPGDKGRRNLKSML